jgi:hypothetical protein
VKHLPVQVRELDRIAVSDSDMPNTNGRQVQRSGTAEPACTSDEDACGFQPSLARRPDLGKDQLAAVALDVRLLHTCRTAPRSKISQISPSTVMKNWLFDFQFYETTACPKIKM